MFLSGNLLICLLVAHKQVYVLYQWHHIPRTLFHFCQEVVPFDLLPDLLSEVVSPMSEVADHVRVHVSGHASVVLKHLFHDSEPVPLRIGRAGVNVADVLVPEVSNPHMLQLRDSLKEVSQYF